jgi:aryl-alcohol dehydrogenase-like predicted oxidoreductase
MKTRSIGSRTVSAIGFGGMPVSIEGRPDEAQAIATIRAAFDAGITLFDTADSYHLHANEVGHNESLIAKALAGHEGEVLIATKGGHLRPGDGSWTQNGHPDYISGAARASLARLGGDAIDLYQFHRPDPAVPYEDSIGALKQVVDDGIAVMAGISNASPDQIRVAQAILGDRLVSVQNQFSPVFRSSLPELELCAELGLAFLPWSPLGGISGAQKMSSAFQRIADAHGVSPQRVCLAWELALAPVVIPIPGARRSASIVDSAAAAELELSEDEIADLSGA